MHTRRTEAIAIACLAAVYIVAGHVGLSFDPVADFATLVWPPTGIALAALLLLGHRVWPGVFIGAAVANLLAQATVPVALGIAAGNTLEAVVGAYLLRKVPGFLVTLESVPSVVGLIVRAALISTTISATFGVATLYFAQGLSAVQLRETWRAWWIGDMVGALLVAPIILVWSRPPRAPFRQSRMEPIALAVALVAVSIVAFLGKFPNVPILTNPFHQAGLLLGVMVWAALRFGQRGAATAAFLLSAAAVVATATGHGPFVRTALQEGLMSLQTFMGLLAATFLLLGGTIAERRWALESAREAQQEAGRANLAKSEFLTMMSHELRTPLTAIAGYSELLRTGVYGTLNQEQTVALSRLGRNEQDLLALIDAVLTFVKLEKGEVAVSRENVPVAEAFDAVEPLLHPDAGSKHFTFERQISIPQLAVQADRKGLEQILASLVSNASKFTEDGGVITLGAESVDGHVRIWVRDSGVGIPEAEIQRVFDPFFQVERGTTRRFSGVGLGLTIARDLARRMDGDVTIHSKVGSGTTASVVLPAARRVVSGDARQVMD